MIVHSTLSYYNYYLHELKRTPGGSGLERMFFPSCMSSIQYFISQLGAKQRVTLFLLLLAPTNFGVFT